MPRAESVVLGGLDVVRVRATSPRRTASVLFVHGMWGGAWVWEHWLPFFAARGWDGYALNLRGRAGSRPVADIGRVPFAAYVEDAAAAARRLGHVVVVGHSMGGLIAQALAAQLEPLAAVAVTPAAPRGIWPLRSAGLALATLRYAPALIRSRPLLPSRRVMMRLALGGLPASERERVYRRLIPESARQARDIALRGVAVDAAAVRCPMAVVAGGDDRLTPPSVVRRVARRYSATLYEYPASATWCRSSRAGSTWRGTWRRGSRRMNPTVGAPRRNVRGCTRATWRAGGRTMTRWRHSAATHGSGDSRRDLSAALLVVAAAWFLTVLAAGANGVFEAPPSRPPLALLAAVAGPPLVFAAIYRASPRFRNFALGLDLRLLTAFQAWRVLGGAFLALYAIGALPGFFAWPAGVGDMAVGLAAPFVLRAMIRGATTWRRQVAWLNIAGLIDFAGAIGTGVLTSNTSLGVPADGAARASLGLLPLSLIPTFAVPLWIIFHLISLLQLRHLGSLGERR